MKIHDILFDGAKYVFKGNKYNKLEDAVYYAKKEVRNK